MNFRTSIFIFIVLPIFLFGFLIFALFFLNLHWTVTESMVPTYNLNDWVFTNIFQKNTYQIGDVVAFKCISEKCYSLYGNIGVSHRLTAIAPDGCMTIIGDNPKYDWSKLPCFYPSDIEIIGVDHKLKFFK